jgi:N-formylglutamate amidohydrolase
VEAIILHIPHSSTKIPDDLRNRFLLSDQELDDELLRMTDRYTDDLFNPEDIRYEKIVFPVSRLVVDPERFSDDQAEPMSKKGMGVIYKLTSNGKTLRGPVSELEREYLLTKFYQPHHEALNKGVAKLLAKYGRALMIDCHSFASLPLKCDFNQYQDRPDICIGTDDRHTPEDLAQGAVRLFREKGYSIQINHPFSGSLVPDQYYQKNKQIYSMMIEINRSLYMDEKTGEKTSGYQKIKSDLNRVLDKICDLEPDFSHKIRFSPDPQSPGWPGRS